LTPQGVFFYILHIIVLNEKGCENMSYINETNTENQFIHDESIISKYAEFKMLEHPAILIKECETILSNLISQNFISTDNEHDNINLITGIIKYYESKGKISVKQLRCLCNFISYESFFDIGPKQMINHIALYDKR
jgi:hypothetical protein